jgi:hypothetical protein
MASAHASEARVFQQTLVRNTSQEDKLRFAMLAMAKLDSLQTRLYPSSIQQGGLSESDFLESVQTLNDVAEYMDFFPMAQRLAISSRIVQYRATLALWAQRFSQNREL